MENENTVEILLVEDNPNDVELTLRALKKYNLANRIHVVKDGEEALDFMFAKGKYLHRDTRDLPKLILLDLKLPKIDGLEVLEKIKSTESLKSVPVIILTSSQEEKDIINSYKFGVNSYIVKPVEFKKFIDSVQEIGYYWLLLNKTPQ